MTHYEIHQSHQLRNEKYEGKDGESEDAVGSDFAGNVSIEKAHSRATIILALGTAD